jgi:uncharacterized phage infection (PIP) family protein YhgE
MLSWPKASKRSSLQAEQLRAVTDEIASLRASLASETQRASDAEEQLSRQGDEMRHQLQQLRDQIDELGRSASAANDEQRRRLEELGDHERLERIEQREAEQEADYRKIGLTLIKLEKRIEQQSEDAATTAAMLLERIGPSR